MPAPSIPHCEACPLQARRCVGMKGDLDAPIVLVGEAPGSQELDAGIPFTGPSGQLLDSILKRVGLWDVPRLTTNALRCRPPIGQVPDARILSACRPRLLHEIEAAPRRVIVLLGASASKSILGNYSFKITQERGRVVETPWGLVLPTYHPAYILRNRGEFPVLVKDLEYAKRLYDTGESKSPGEVRFNVATPDSVGDLVARLRAHKLIAVDIETSSYNPRTGRILCVGLSWEKNKVVIIPDDLVQHLRPLLEDPVISFIWHNGKFDCSFLYQAGVDARVDADTLLMAYSLNEEGHHDLKSLATDELGSPEYKEVVKQYAPKKTDSFENIPKPKLYKYLAQDADNTFQLHQILRPRLEREPGPLWAYEHVLIPASRFLQDVERYGFWVDRERLATLRVDLQASCAALRGEMFSLAGREFNPRSPKQLRPILAEMGVQAESTSKVALEAAAMHPFVAALLKYRREVKTLGTYVDGLEKRLEIDTDNGSGWRIHSTYLLHGTRTGRLSSRNPNLQNITGTADPDRRVKRMFGAPPGRTLLEWDFSQAELRTLACLSKDQAMMQVYIDGRDLHDEGALEFYGPSFTDRQRFNIKTVNFGLVYGRQAVSIAAFLKIKIREAQALIDRFARSYPDAWGYLEHNRQRAAAGLWVQSALGRRRRFRLVTQEDLGHIMNEAANMPISSTSSDLLLKSGIHMAPQLAEWDAFIVNLVHDSLMAECPTEMADAVAEYGMRIMEETPRLLLRTEVPFKADVKVGQYWGELEKWPAHNAPAEQPV